MDGVLEKVREFADSAHGGQQRRYAPERYIVHPVRVMEICKEYTREIPVLAAALLHDVLEDTPVNKTDLEVFLHQIMNEAQAEITIRLVEELTDVYIEEDYPAWNRRKRKQKEFDRLEKASAAAQTIKYADIIDNCPEIAAVDPDFADRYLTECKILLGKIKNGDQRLHERAVLTVLEAIGSLKRKQQV